MDKDSYTPFEPEAATLFIQLVFSRHEAATIALTFILPLGHWGDVFGDHATASALKDRIVHHAEVLTLKGNSYWVKDKKLSLPSKKTENKAS